jgi:hypothetical protein
VYLKASEEQYCEETRKGSGHQPLGFTDQGRGSTSMEGFEKPM